jgi:signal transduction histidine kinase/ligand-binding sensor domain-containing protein
VRARRSGEHAPLHHAGGVTLQTLAFRSLGPGIAATAVALVLGLARPALALDPAKSLSQCTVDVWQARDGLPGAWVRGIAQTPDGYLWINTLGGVGRYDGARMWRFEPAGPDPAPFDIAQLSTDPDGTLIIAGAYGDLICLRGETTGACLASGVHMPRGDRVMALARDGEVLWVATRHRLLRFDRGRLALDRPMAGLPFGRVNAFLRDHTGRLWVASTSGLFLRDGDEFRVHVGAGGPVTTHVTALAEGAQGRIWATTINQLIRVDQPAVFDPGELRHGRLATLLEDRDGNIWVGSDGGLLRMRDGHFVRFGRGEGLPDEQITALFEDREGSLWVGTRSGGIAQLTDRTLDTGSGPPALNGQQVETVCETDDGSLWLGTGRLGLWRWKDRIATRIGTAEGLPSNHVTSVTPGAPGELWVGTPAGVARWRNGRLDRPIPIETTVASLYRDSLGALWIGADDGTVYRWRGDRVDAVIPSDSGLGQIRGLGEDPQGRLWIAGSGALGRYADGRLVRITRGDGRPVRMPRSIHIDAQGTVWFGTAGTGLARVEGERLRSFGAEAGLLPDQLYQVITDDLGFLWMGTSRGLVRVSARAVDDVARGRRQRVDLVSFERSDERRDVAATRVHQPGAWRARDGRLWFATDVGVVTVDPRHLRVNAVPPTVLIQEATVDGRPLRRGIPNLLPPGPGNLELHFAAVTLLEPEKAAHRYLLEGFDDHWIDAGTRRVAYYTNIPAGHYRFRVQASNADGIWNESGDAVAFYIAPHFYRTPLFYAACAAALLSLAFWFHRSRLARVRAESLAAAAERTRVARELHDTLLQGMSAVAMRIHAVRRGMPAGAPASEKLAAIEASVTTSLAETRRFVWDLREQPEAGGVNLAEALTTLSASFSEAGGDRAATCHVTVEGAVQPLPPAVTEELVRIAGEALSNAFRHADARHIETRLCYEDQQVTLAVADDGRGFEPGVVAASRPGHFGLQGLRERAARLSGTLRLESGPGQGTRVEVVVPLGRRESAVG